MFCAPLRRTVEPADRRGVLPAVPCLRAHRFRLETRERYDSPNETEALAQFVAGKPIDLAWFGNWLSMIREVTANGRVFSRVRVVSLPLSDYSRFGMFCSQYTNAAGEDIRYLNRDHVHDLPSYDYWLFDSRLLLKMHFDEDERFLGGEVIKDPAVIVQHSYWRDAAWHRALRRDEFAADIRLPVVGKARPPGDQRCLMTLPGNGPVSAFRSSGSARG